MKKIKVKKAIISKSLKKYLQNTSLRELRNINAVNQRILTSYLNKAAPYFVEFRYVEGLIKRKKEKAKKGKR